MKELQSTENLTIENPQKSKLCRTEGAILATAQPKYMQRS